MHEAVENGNASTPGAEVTPRPAPSTDATSPEELAARLARLEATLARLTAEPPGPRPEGFMPLLGSSLQKVSRFSKWFEIPVLHEFMQIGRMYLDPRYRLSRVAQFAVPVIIVLLVLNYLLFNWVFTLAVMAPILERVFIVILAMILYGILSRERLRYQAVLDYLSQVPR